MRRVINIHHNDMDGWASGAQIWKYFTDKGYEVIDMECWHGHPIPVLEDLQSDDILAVTDFSLTEKDLAMVKNAGIKDENYIWIDHHKSSIERFPRMSNLPGIRSTSFSAAYLTWLWCNGYQFAAGKITKVNSDGAQVEVTLEQVEVPECIKLVDDFDTFKLKIGTGNDSLCYNMAFMFFIKSIYDKDQVLAAHKKIALALDLLNKPELVETPGKILYADYLERGRDLVYHNAYHVKLRKFQYLNAVALNTTEIGSKIFEIVYDDYEIGLVYKYVPIDTDGTMKMAFSIYRLGQNPDKKIDVSVIASTFGGGGHTGAAGFSTNGTLPFL